MLWSAAEKSLADKGETCLGKAWLLRTTGASMVQGSDDQALNHSRSGDAEQEIKHKDVK